MLNVVTVKKSKLTLYGKKVKATFWSLFHRHCNEWNLHFIISQLWSLDLSSLHRSSSTAHRWLIVETHRWENFWLFKLLLLMNASAYVKHRCNTTKHSQLFTFLANKLLFNVVSVLRKKCWLVQYVSLSPKRKNMFHTKSTCCLTVKRIVDKLNMFHFYPNAKIWSHTKSTCDLTVKGICWSSSHLSHMLPFSLIFASKQKKMLLVLRPRQIWILEESWNKA